MKAIITFKTIEDLEEMKAENKLAMETIKDRTGQQLKNWASVEVLIEGLIESLKQYK